MRMILATAAILAFATSATAEEGRTIDRITAEAADLYQLADIDWKDEPLLPDGAKSALLIGDPSQPGVFMTPI